MRRGIVTCWPESSPGSFMTIESSLTRVSSIVPSSRTRRTPCTPAKSGSSEGGGRIDASTPRVCCSQLAISSTEGLPSVPRTSTELGTETGGTS